MPYSAHEWSLCVLVFQQVKALIQDALFVFDADKTGVADYALESSGESLKHYMLPVVL